MNAGAFKKGEKRPNQGRPPGLKNKTTIVLKDAILMAAHEVGEDGKGRGHLTGYLRSLAKNDPRSFSSLLGRVLPLQVVGDGDGPLTVVVRRITTDA